MSLLDYVSVRLTTERLAAGLSAEDQTVQSMPDVSPTKWHRAHTSWFFETFVLSATAGYKTFDPAYAFLFNSYYESVGPRHARPQRGLLTRPGIADIAAYREHVDGAMLAAPLSIGSGSRAVIELGLHHEQQHQELLVMDIQHVLSTNPLFPSYGQLPWAHPAPVGGPGWIGREGHVAEIGHVGDLFAFDNEGPHHAVLLHPFEIATALVTNAEWLNFIGDGGYSRPDLWMSDGWNTVQSNGWTSPGYWHDLDGVPHVFGLAGLMPIDSEAPVAHISWYEADAFARWAGGRLPLEAEWETAAPEVDDPGAPGWYGAVWQWTASPYVAYPGFRPSAGAVGEYNGKFMVNQQVLRGSGAATPPGHGRRTYRNFFPPDARWAFSGLRLARDGS